MEVHEVSSWGFCHTYPFPDRCTPDTVGGQAEAFAEAIADFVIWTTYRFGGKQFDYPNEVPDEYDWMGATLFGGSTCSASSCN